MAVIKRAYIRCLAGYAIAATIAAVLGVQLAASERPEDGVKSISGHVTISTEGLFTTIETAYDSENSSAPDHGFRVQYASRPPVRVSFDGFATILYSEGSLAVIPENVSGPALAFTVGGNSPIAFSRLANVQHIEAIGLARYRNAKALFGGPLATFGPSEPACTDCAAGGGGSRSCSVSCGGGCSVSCAEEYFSCCNCLPTVTCHCCR